jgi:hypothetical protein
MFMHTEYSSCYSLLSNLSDSASSNDQHILHTLVYYADTGSDNNSVVLKRQRLQFEIVLHEPQSPSTASDSDSSTWATTDVFDDYVPEDSGLSELEDDDWLDDDPDFHEHDMNSLDETLQTHGTLSPDSPLSLESNPNTTKPSESPSGEANSTQNPDSASSLAIHSESPESSNGGDIANLTETSPITHDSSTLSPQVDNTIPGTSEREGLYSAALDQTIQDHGVSPVSEPIIRDAPRCTVGHEKNINLLLPDR